MNNAGAVFIPSSPSGPDGSNVETISLATPDIPGEPLASNLFGAAVTTGLFDSDTLRDLPLVFRSAERESPMREPF